MGLPATKPLQTEISGAITNYLSTDRSCETLYTLRGAVKVPLLKGGTLSFDVGEQVKTQFPEGEECKTTRQLALEAKYNQQITDNISVYLRGRGIGDTYTGRAAVNFKYPITENLNGYTAIHGSLKKDLVTEEVSFTSGAWTGIEGQINNKINWFTEVQYNFGKDWMWNSGIKIKLF